MTRKKRGFCDWFNLVAVIWMFSDIFLHAFCLRDLKIFVPEAVIMGNAATLTCQYDLEQAALYSVRWYFESEEFYRYVPKESPPSLVFPVSGISVDLTASDGTSVTLRSVTRELTGQFHCEVSEDAPLFHTAIRHSQMQVVELPKEDPTMTLASKQLAANDNLKAYCTVGKSFPSANITWFINGRKIYKTPFQRIAYRTYEGTGTSSSLELFPHSQVLQDLYMTLLKFQTSFDVQCEVSILHVYHKSVSKRVAFTPGSHLNSTVSPNLLGLESGSKRGSPGDPDNAPLTGRASATGSWDSIFLILLYVWSICWTV